MRALFITLTNLFPFLLLLTAFLTFLTIDNLTYPYAYVLLFLTGFVSFQLILTATKNVLYSLLTFIIFIVFSLSNTTHVLPYSSLGILLSYFLLYYYETDKSHYVFLSGVVSSLLIALNINAGIASLLVCLFYFFCIRKFTLQTMLPLVYGIMWGLIIAFFTLFIAGSFASFYTSYIHSLPEHIAQVVSIQFSFTFLLSPFTLSLIAFTLLATKLRYHLLHILLVLILFSIAYPPIATSVSLVGIPLALLLRFTTHPLLRALLFFIAIAHIAVGFAGI